MAVPLSLPLLPPGAVAAEGIATPPASGGLLADLTAQAERAMHDVADAAEACSPFWGRKRREEMTQAHRQAEALFKFMSAAAVTSLLPPWPLLHFQG